MNVGMLALLGPLVAGQPAPVPGMGPPAAVAGMPASPVVPFPQPGMGLPVPAPVLAAKVIAPEGVRVGVYPGAPGIARMYPTPSVFGLRPGYSYRFELSNLPYSPGRVLYPEVTVHGTLVPRPGMKYMDYPVPLVFTAGDIERVLAGSVITKVIYLEDPEKAIPTEVRPDTPIEFPNASEDAAVKAALASGRLVAILRIGDKIPNPEYLRYTAIDGTILLPGEKYLKAPLAPPTVPFYACKLFDPLLGPKGPKEECLVDGGDRGDPLGIGPYGRLGGLNPTDVGVEYTIAGRRKVTTSNVVCICSPRFMIQRVEVAPAGYSVPVSPVANIHTLTPGFIRDRHAPMVDVGREKPVEVDARNRPMAYVGRVGTSFYVGMSRPSAVGQVQGVAVVGVVVEPFELTAYPTLCPLTVTKSVDPEGPVPAGAEVTFTIKYVNTGNKPITDVVVSDSLSGRLEYVAGSAQSDRPANFAAGENEAGSVVLRWELPGTLLPGQSGTIRFRAKVR